LCYIEDLSDNLAEFEADVNKSIEMMTNEVFKYFDDNYNEFNPELLENYKLLKQKIKDQKDENANHLKQIDFLNTEIKQILENIIKLGNRLGALEALCGFDNDDREGIKNNTEYEENHTDSKID
jgi:septal ring factor EnvC (AmiA/AmiB activator)